MEIESIKVEANAELVTKIRHLILHYQTVFRTTPRGVAMSPREWLQLGVTLQYERYRHVSAYGASDPITVDGVQMFCKANGPLEVLVDPEHAAQFEYLKQKNDKKLYPLLMGA